MIPIVFTGENRRAAKDRFDSTIKLLQSRGKSLNKIDCTNFGSPSDVLANLNTSMLFGDTPSFAILYPSDCPSGCQKTLVKFVKSLAGRKTPVIIFEPEPKSAFLKEARKALWKIVEYKAKNRFEAKSEIAKAVAPLGQRLTREAKLAFELLLGDDQFRLCAEIKKLSGYPDALTLGVLSDLVPEAKEAKVWKLVDLLFEGKHREARTHAGRLLASGEQPPMISHLLYSQFRKLALFSALLAEDQNTSRATLVSQTQIPPFAYDRFRFASQKYSLKKLKKLLVSATELEYETKTGGTNQESALALFLAECSC